MWTNKTLTGIILSQISVIHVYVYTCTYIILYPCTCIYMYIYTLRIRMYVHTMYNTVGDTMTVHVYTNADIYSTCIIMRESANV